MAMLAASIVIYTLFLTLVFNKRAKPTMSKTYDVIVCDHKLVHVWYAINMFFSPNRATTRLGGEVHRVPISGDGW